jgi:NADPH:quinone reductase-like Zn-dependent oxidoreductase
MKAIHLTSYGDPLDGVQCVNIPEPASPAEGEVLIQLEFSPINFSDILLAKGLYGYKPALPLVIGGEGVGIVIAVGRGVSGIHPGDRVTIPQGTFAWAQRIIAPAENIFVVLPGIEAQQAAMLTINPPTAVLLLSEFVKLKSGDWVAFNAGNSAIARGLIAVSKSRGLKTLAIVRQANVIKEVQDAGADVVLVENPELIEQAKAATGGAEILLGLDAVGGESTNALAKILGTDSQLVAYALMSGKPLVVNQGDLVFKRMSIHGFWMYYPKFIPKLRAAMTDTAALMSSGDLKIKVQGVYSLTSIREAVQHALAGGKVLLDFKD